MNDLEMNPFECTLEELSSFQTFSDESYTSHVDLDNNSVQTPTAPPPAKQARTSGSSRRIASMATSSSSSQIISFGNVELSSMVAQPSYDNKNNNKTPNYYCSPNKNHGVGIKRSVAAMNSNNRSPLVAQEHVLAERKRREKLSQRFVALSALIPDLKKVTFMFLNIKFLFFIIMPHISKKQFKSFLFFHLSFYNPRVHKLAYCASDHCSSLN